MKFIIVLDEKQYYSWWLSIKVVEFPQIINQDYFVPSLSTFLLMSRSQIWKNWINKVY